MGIASDLKNIARAPSNARALGQAAAQAAMAQVLGGHTTATETAAFVIAMRMKAPALDEVSGFLAAAQEHCLPVPSDRPVVLIPSYSGSRHLPILTPLLALWLARQGVRVLMHGPLALARRVGSAEVLHDLGLAPALDVDDILRAWHRREPAFMPTRVLCPPLQLLLDLRRVLGVRGPGHLVARLLNPVQGARALRLVQHTDPQFGALMTAWAQRAGADALLLRGTEGEPVADPRRQPRIDTWLAGRLRPELGSSAHEGVLAELPLLPRSTDAAATAIYVQEVLSGMRPAPAPLVRQAALIVAAIETLQHGDAPDLALRAAP